MYLRGFSFHQYSVIAIHFNLSIEMRGSITILDYSHVSARTRSEPSHYELELELELEMTSLNAPRILLSLLVLCVLGCEPAEINITKKASYSDLVVTYNAEVQTLDNLEGKRKNLITEYAEKAQADAFKSAVNSLESASKQSSSSNPNDALDRAVAAAEAQAKLLEKVGQSSGSKQSTVADYPEELKRKLAELDAEIDKQKERVERARKARDAAEAK